MNFKAAKLVVQDKPYINLSWSCSEALCEGADHTGAGDEEKTSQSDPFLELKALRDNLAGSNKTNKGSAKNTRKRRHYVFILDTSGSMNGDPIETLQETAISFLEMLRSDDLFSVVTFNNTAKLLFNQRTITDLPEVQTSIQQIKAMGGTNLCKGLFEGLNAVQVESDIQNVVVLLGDGCANIGVVKPSQIVSQTLPEADKKLAVLYSIGIGHSYNNDLLNELSNGLSGLHYHLDSSDDVPYVIGNIMGDVQPLVFKDTVLTANLPPSCIEEIQSPNHIDCRKASEGIEIRLRALRPRDQHSINVQLSDDTVSSLPDTLTIHFHGRSVSSDVNIREEFQVVPFDVDDSNPEHEVYYTNFARILFTWKTNVEYSARTEGNLNSLKVLLMSLPRSRENATISQIIEDVDELEGYCKVDEAKFTYVQNSAQCMHGKARGIKKSKSNRIATAYESPLQNHCSADLFRRVSAKKRAKNGLVEKEEE